MRQSLAGMVGGEKDRCILVTGPKGAVFGHTGGHTGGDANVCLSSTRCATLISVKYFAWDDAKNAKLKADRGLQPHARLRYPTRGAVWIAICR
jgi:hypothetical protein